MNMESPGKRATRFHEWTSFEKHTLLCLMAKNMHLEGKGDRQDAEGVKKRHAYMNVATQLNTALNGELGNFERDIDHKEVSKMIDRMLKEKKGVVGKGGYMERATRGRITRGLKRIWEREPSFDYDGTQGEWAQWRKKSEDEKRCVAAGTALKPDSVSKSFERDAASGILRNVRKEGWPSATVPVKSSATTRFPFVRNSGVRASSNILTADVPTESEYLWAGTGGKPAYRSYSTGDSTAINSYHPSYSAGTTPSQIVAQQKYVSYPNEVHVQSRTPLPILTTQDSRDNVRLAKMMKLEMGVCSTDKSKKWDAGLAGRRAKSENLHFSGLEQRSQDIQDTQMSEG